MAKLGIFKHDYDLVILYAILHAPCLDSTSPGAKQEPNRTLLGNSKTVHMAKDCHHDPALVESGGFRPGDEVLASASAANRALLATGVSPFRVPSTSSPTSFLVSLKSMTWAAETRN